MATLTQGQFLRDVISHQMHILRNDGMYRHVRFKREGTMCMHFDLVTLALVTWLIRAIWAALCFHALMTCLSFSCADRLHGKDDRKLKINLGYWSEKLKAADGGRNSSNGAKEFSPKAFTKLIHEWRIGWIREYRDILSKEQRRELWVQVNEDVLSKVDDGEIRAYDAAYDFKYEADGKSFQFDDLYEHNCYEYTHRFIWCCYALAWGIKQYDFVVPTSKDAA